MKIYLIVFRSRDGSMPSVRLWVQAKSIPIAMQKALRHATKTFDRPRAWTIETADLVGTVDIP